MIAPYLVSQPNVNHISTESIKEIRYDLLAPFDGRHIRREISQSGLIIDGTVYASPCRTRYGSHPYCRHMRHAVHSITKSLAGWLTALRMAEKFGPQILDYKVLDYVDIAAEHGGWSEVTFDHLLSMVSGIGDVEPRRVDHYVDTRGTANAMAFYDAETVQEKLTVLARVEDYPWDPGEVFRYASYEPFVLAVALSALLQREEGPDADLWDMMNREVFEPIGIAHMPIFRKGPDADARSVVTFGHGLYVTLEDVAKIEALIRAGGRHEGRQILHAGLLQESLANAYQHSYPTGWRTDDGLGEVLYFRSLWLEPHASSAGCVVYVPMMSGVGGNAILLMPNGITALRFAGGPDDDDDSDTYDQVPMRRVADAIRSLCRP